MSEQPEQTGQQHDPDKDRAAVLEAHFAYNQANSTADIPLLHTVWDDDPRNVFFNLSGHNYRGLAHWTKLWEYYGPRIAYDFPWITFDENVTINGDVAWVTCLRFHQFHWIGEEENPFPDSKPQLTRSTEIFVRKPDGWKVVHTHFSPGALSPRPGNV